MSEQAAVPRKSTGRSRALLGFFFISSGINHFVIPRAYQRIVPPGIGDPATLVTVSSSDANVARVNGPISLAAGEQSAEAGRECNPAVAGGFVEAEGEPPDGIERRQ